MMFASDNAGPAAPEIMAALAAANDGYARPYGNDPFTERAIALVRDVFEAPEASVHLVATGTAANALALAVLTKPWDAILAERLAHVEMDECGAPEFFTGGAKIRRIEGVAAKITPHGLNAALAELPKGDVHSVQRGPLTLTQITELGTAYSVAEITALTQITRAAGLKTHLDGARIANALPALGCSPAEMTWKAGIDAVSLGGTKNGCLGVEAVVFFDPDHAWEVALRRKRAGHLWSKGKYLGAQMAAYLEDGLWLRLAAQANARMAELVAGLNDIPDAQLLAPPAANLAFLHLPRAAHQRAFAAGAVYGLHPNTATLDGPGEEPILCRVVCDWSRDPEDVSRLLSLWKG